LYLSLPATVAHTVFNMRFLTAAKALLVAAVTASAHNIVLPAHGVECFYENLHKDDVMTVTFQVGDREFGSAGNLEIDFWVCTRTSGHNAWQAAS
jgi:p24 family protein beta-1